MDAPQLRPRGEERNPIHTAAIPEPKTMRAHSTAVTPGQATAQTNGRSSAGIFATWAWALALTLTLASCRASRLMHIRSEPSGADIRVNDKFVGKTPFDYEFVHYGTSRISLDLEGHLPLSQVVEVSAPWYGRFPWDIFSEVLIPIGWEDHHYLQFKLDPSSLSGAAPDLRRVLERAEILRRAGPEGPRDLPPASRLKSVGDARLRSTGGGEADPPQPVPQDEGNATPDANTNTAGKRSGQG